MTDMQAPDPGRVPGMEPDAFRALVAAVQANCHVSDARHAGDLTMCIYLLQMREFFRWEQGVAPLQPLPQHALGAWLGEREALWESLEGAEFGALSLAQEQFGPFDVDAINARLQPVGLVYGAGYTAPGRASFFLGALASVRKHGDTRILTSAAEYARGIFASPAVLAADHIHLRQDALERWLWQKYESWTLRRPAGAFLSALGQYGFAQDGAIAVQRMAADQADTLVLHELGEMAAGRLLGSRWQAMRSSLSCRVTDLVLRTVRDHLADCLVTLPALLERGSPAALHFWFSNLEGLRADLFPRLAPAYACWCAGDQGQSLGETVAAGRVYWQALCEEIMALHAAHGEAAPTHIRRLVSSGAARL